MVSVVREFVGLPSPTATRAQPGGHPCQGLFHHAAGAKPKVAVIASHYQIDFSGTISPTASRRAASASFGWNTPIPRVRKRLRPQTRFGGHRCRRSMAPRSRGGGTRCPPRQFRWRIADGGISGADLRCRRVRRERRTPGRPDVLTAWMDGSVIDESDPCAKRSGSPLVQRT